MYYIIKNGPLSGLFDFLLELLFPMGTYCICCGKYIDLSRSYLICDDCIDNIRWGHIRLDLDRERARAGRTYSLDSVMSCMVYGIFARKLIFDLKYNGRTYLSRPISMIMADRLISDSASLALLGTLDYVLPVPMHRKKERERGGNQAAIIAEQLTERILHYNREDLDTGLFNFTCLKNGLLRTRPTAAQRSVSGAERYANLEGAFEINRAYTDLFAGSVILLVDDIYTTGATADRCAKLLKDAGAKEVHIITLATGNDYLFGEF